jgi:hypothetical protein
MPVDGMAKGKIAAKAVRMAGHRRQMLLYMDPIFIKAVKRAAVDRAVSASFVVEEAVKEWLDRHRIQSHEMSVRDQGPEDERSGLVAELGRRYVWWSDGQQVDRTRVIAQVMELGTYEDIRRIEAVFAPEELRDVMLRAPAGAIGQRSWDFWRGRLRFAGCATIPQTPPRRSFHAEML